MTALAALHNLHGENAPRTLVARSLSIQAIYGAGRPQIADGEQFSIGWDVSGKQRAPQPVSFAGGRFTLVADLRLTHQDAIIRDLQLDGSEAAGDAALVARAFEAWGCNTFDRLRGEFAIIIWDAKAREFTLARDFAGSRPLHFFKGDDFIAAASMPSGLNALPDVPGKPDSDAIAAAMAVYEFKADKTHWLDVRRVLPGHYVTLSATKAIQERYWNPHLQPLKLASYDDYVEGLRHHVDAAVASAIGQESHIATHLSAGLDSSTVTVRAAALLHGRGRITAYTAAPRIGYAIERKHKIIDEAVLAAQTAALHANIEHVIWRPKPEWSTRELDRAFDFAQAPPTNICNLHWLHGIMDAMKLRGETVLLTGTMGNIGLSHDGSLLAVAALSERNYAEYISEIWGLRRAGMKTMLRALRATLGKYYRGTARRNHVNPGRIESKMKGFGETYADVFLKTAARIDKGLLNKAALAGWAVDVRDPTADRDLVEFALSLPSWTRVHNGKPRSVLRDMLAGEISETARVTEKRGLQAADWHEGAGQHLDWLRNEVEASTDFLPANTIIDTERLQGLVDDWHTQNWDDDEVYNARRLALLRGVSVGHFIRRASGSNR